MRWHSAPTARSTSSRTERSGTRRRRPPRSSMRSASDETANGPFDLVFFGNESADAGNFQIGIRVAYALGRPVATGLKGVGVDGETVRCEQEVAGGRDVYVLPLPAVVTVLEGLNLPRYPSVPAKLRAQRKPVDASSPARPESQAREGPSRRSRRTGQGGGDPRPRARGSTRRRGGAAEDRRGMTALVVVERTPDGSTTSRCRRSRSRAPYAADEPVDALVVGDSDGLEGVLGEHGIATVHVAEHDAFSSYAPAAVARAALDVMGRTATSAVVAAGNERGNEVLAHVAAIADLPFAANCIEATAGDPALVTRMRWGGSLLEEARLHGTPALMTVQPHSVAAGGGRRRSPPASSASRPRSTRPTSSCAYTSASARRRAASRSPTPRSSSRAAAAQARRRGSGSSRSSPACSAGRSAARAP